nr:transposon TX1 [Tanacetum cinerariifolium]
MNDDIFMTYGTPVIKHVSTIHLSLKVARVSLAGITILVISVGSLKHALLVENLVVYCCLSSTHPLMLPCERPANSIILRVKGVFTASLKGLFRWSGLRKGVFDINFKRPPPPEVDPMIPTVVDPMLSSRVNLHTSKSTSVSVELGYVEVSDEILGKQSREFRRTRSMCVVPVRLPKVSPEHLLMAFRVHSLALQKARADSIEEDGIKVKMLKQKARIQWYKEGDENPKYFHANVRKRYRKNGLRGLVVDGM